MSINDKIDSVFSKEYHLKTPSLNSRNYDPKRFLKTKNIDPSKQILPTKTECETHKLIRTNLKKSSKRLSLEQQDGNFYTEFLNKMKEEAKNEIITILPCDENADKSPMTHNNHHHSNHTKMRGSHCIKPGMMKKEKSQGNFRNKNMLLFLANQSTSPQQNHSSSNMNPLIDSIKSDKTLKEEKEMESNISKKNYIKDIFNNSINPKGISSGILNNKPKRNRESTKTSNILFIDNKCKLQKKSTNKNINNIYTIENASNFDIIKERKQQLLIQDNVVSFTNFAEYPNKGNESDSKNIINNIIFTPNKCDTRKINDVVFHQGSFGNNNKKPSVFCCF